MIEYIAYGVLLAIGFHLGENISNKYGLGPRQKKRAKLLKGVGIQTKTLLAKLQGGL